MEHCFFHLDAPIQMVCNKDVPMPVAAGLQREVMVSEEDVVRACRAVLAA
jgi:pyruvate/2-oxoglutarate/acetoin dehydrogenase E1 component